MGWFREWFKVPEGVYFYVLNATGEDGTPYKEKAQLLFLDSFIKLNSNLYMKIHLYFVVFLFSFHTCYSQFNTEDTILCSGDQILLEASN